jgi:hypothetical protein
MFVTDAAKTQAKSTLTALKRHAEMHTMGVALQVVTDGMLNRYSELGLGPRSAGSESAGFG